MSLQPGTRIGHYEIRSLLGAGGMGEVYLAQDTRLSRQVALKVLPDDVVDDRERLRRFEQEAQAVSALNHQNIITIHEIGAEGDTHFIVTEFIEGETLRRKLRTRLEVGEAVDIATQIAAALDAAHRSGIVHRDIKPENLMLREDGLAKVLDFGLAKVAERKGGAPEDSQTPTRAQVRTMPGVVMGTVAYMSPEQARGQAVDARTDVFSLGLVLYEMLAGRPPFAGETASDVMAAILTSEPAPLDEGTPAELRRIVRKSLQKKAGERYQTAKDLLIDLKSLKHDLDVAAELERSGIPTRGDQPAPTTVSDTQRATGDGRGLRKPKSRRELVLVVTALTVAALAAAAFYFLRSGGTAIESVAVLPFVNEGGNAETEYLSDGMTETLISSLSQLPTLNVKPRSTVFRYKGEETSPQAIGQELKVQAILNGRVVQRGQELSLFVELVDVALDKVVWSRQYIRQQADLVSLQSEIARDVSSELKIKLTGADEQRVAKIYTTNPEAYRLYLQGRFYWNKREEKDFRRAVEYFNQAVALDPNYAPAYAGLADSYALLATYGFMPQAIPKAREFARQALALDESLAEPHATLGYVLASYDRDFAGAERELQRAIELNPNYATAHQWYGELLTYVGRFDESFAEFRRGLEIEPLSLPINWDFGRCLYMGRKYDESLAQLKKTIELDPGFARAHLTLGDLYRIRKEYADAVEEHARFYELRGEPQNAALARESFARGGWGGYLRLVTAENSPLRANNWMVARAHMELGETDQAFAALNKAYETRTGGLSWLKVDPLLDPLRSDPRFAELMRKVALPQ